MRFLQFLFVPSFLFTTSLTPAFAAGCFLKPLVYDVGPTAVAVGDVNNDGNLDLIVTGGGGSKTITVLLGQGDGSFRIGNEYAVGQPGHKAVLGDFNHDGNLDVAVPVQNFLAHNPGMSVLLGNGDGTFQNAILYKTGEGPNTAAVGDFNRDGKLDIAVATSDGISLLLGDGDGTFAAQQLISDPGSVLVGLAAADINQDGKLDMVATSVENNIDVFMGNGNGTFQSARKYHAGAGPGEVRLVDINGDGLVDVVTENRLGEEGDTGIGVSIGKGDGTFHKVKITSASKGSRPSSLVVADFGGDGLLDILENSNSPSQLVLYKGGGNWGGLASAAFNAATSTSIETGDFNHDGRPDAVVTGGKTFVLLNSGQCR